MERIVCPETSVRN